MNKLNPAIDFFIILSKTSTILTQRFDRSLNGIAFNEFLILYFLDQSEDKKMRRVDLAEKIGVTASGITRMLLPMEKIGLIKNGEIEGDARVRFVEISKSGRKKMNEALERLEIMAEDFLPKNKTKVLKKISEFLLEIGGRLLIN